MSSECDILVSEALTHMAYAGSVTAHMRYGHGHINDTYYVKTMAEDGEHGYILQRMNKTVFKDPVALMKNVVGVTEFLKEEITREGGDPTRETLNVILTKSGDSYYVDSQGEHWRSYLFISNAICYETVEKPEDFYRSAKAFGRFQRQLSTYPAQDLVDTIPDFHNTPVRLEALRAAIEADVCGRAASAQEEICFALERGEEAGVVMEMAERGEIPLRVTHNDTKLNNIMFDASNGDALCIIDLDTIMPGFSIFDFGDSIRFGANTAVEDELDLSKVSLSLPLFEIYVKGYMEGCKGSLTAAETDMLPLGAKTMTYECGVRFLTDYLQGDVYFKTSREKHNLDRCHTQFALVADMEKKWGQMKQIVDKYK